MGGRNLRAECRKAACLPDSQRNQDHRAHNDHGGLDGVCHQHGPHAAGGGEYQHHTHRNTERHKLADTKQGLENLCQGNGDGGNHAQVASQAQQQRYQPVGRSEVVLEQLRHRSDARLAEAGSAGPCAPVWIAVDQEGGRVRRLSAHNGFRDWPSALNMGRRSPQHTWETALDMGLMLADMGINLNFAPSLDLHRPDSPAIGRQERAFSSEPAGVARHGAAFARGMRNARIVCCYKHFPGHGSARGDTHEGYADISETWSERELEPYRDLLGRNLPAMVMVAHVTLRRLDDRPASLSPAVVTGLLREKLGFRGVIVTDDLDMEAVASQYPLKERIRLAVNAGADILLFGNNLHYDEELPFLVHAALMELIDEGDIPPERIRASYERIRELKAFVNNSRQ